MSEIPRDFGGVAVRSGGSTVGAPPAVRTHGAMSVRLAALGGVVFFVLMVLQATLRSGIPSATDPGQEVFDYVADHEGRLQVAAMLLGLAMPAVLLWLSGLVRALRRAEGGTAALAIIALGGGALAAASTVTGALVEGTMANRIEDLGPSGAGVWWTMFLMSTGATLLGLLLVTGATALVGWQTGLFGRWFAIVSVVLTLASLIGALTIGYAGSGLQVVAGLAVLLDGVWILLVSLFLWREPEVALP